MAGDNVNYDFSDKEKEFLEKELGMLKKEYQKPQMSKKQFNEMRKRMEAADMENKKERGKSKVIKYTAIAAAFIGAFIILPNTSANVAYAMGKIPVIGQLVEVVTIRDYQHESERNNADIEVPEIIPETQVADPKVQEKLERTADEINEEIKSITDELITHFEKYMEDEQGYQDIVVKSEVLATTQDYFTLKLICYQGAGSGYQWNYYYTIDLNTGERLQLKDLFNEGADYITPISENIKDQMQEQMRADEMVYYWLDNEIEEWNFKSITEETEFYVNEKGNVVIGFDEGEVAPMYMGTVEFEIPAEVLADIRK
ncbi:MAG: RsiV family protein [Lachnospiraceae bacterium]